VIEEGDISASLFYASMLLTAALREPITTMHILLKESETSSQKRQQKRTNLSMKLASAGFV
jgi:hypothetical protein